ncbi:hypothetical protein BH20ACT1_BH20ACT1_00720 [soil metagenome]
MTRLAKTAVSPAERLEHLLHPWTTFVVVPLFALANAGVSIKASSFAAPGAVAVTAGVILGLVVGKTLGITAAAWLAARSGLGRFPEGATWPMVPGIAAVAGIVSLFVSELSFEPGALQTRPRSASWARPRSQRLSGHWCSCDPADAPGT